MKSVQELEALTADQPHNPMRPNVRRDHEEEIARLDAIVSGPVWQPGDRARAARRAKELRAMIVAQSPKALTGPQKDAVAKKAEEVLQDVVRPAMLPLDVMKRNPAGALRAYQRGESSRSVKQAILAVKRARLAVADADDPEAANLEPFRPGGYDGFSRVDAQIPGKFAQSPQSKANWPLGEPTIDTPQKVARRREMTPEQKLAVGARLKLARAAKAAKHAADLPPTEG